MKNDFEYRSYYYMNIDEAYPLLGVLVILQNAYKHENNNSSQNIINTINLTSNIQSNLEKK
jgi:hypothetical protein